ncbi:DEAD/DEAH box helicase family protein [Mesorhizobium sp. ANAO-SY3R2]|uniref:DEAD/DEAH box helicase family protein n=1 Tax=Mesorhizobium sp. ANAO-SY3R2 TaxID=3166644 RepID=UPI00366B8F7A
MTGLFLDERRLLDGPWQAFERDVARALICAGFQDVRIVGGTGDMGADVVGVKDGKVWVIQCKFTSTSSPPKAAVEEVIQASRFYEADVLALATSRPAGKALSDEIARVKRLGFVVHLLTPSKLMQLVQGVATKPPTARSLRPYQEEACERLFDALEETGRAQIVLATGLGKTVVMAEVAARLFSDGRLENGRMLVLADKRELVRQLQSGFWAQLPKTVPTHLLAPEEEPSFWEGITFATMQTVHARLSSLPTFDVVFVDEAHHIGAPTYRDVLHNLAPLRLAGVTATPWRGDEFDIDTLLGQPLVRVGISDGLKYGYLSEVDYRLLADNIDWEFVQGASNFGYTVTELNKRLIIPTRDEEAARVVASAFKSEGRRAGLVFSPSVAHADHFTATLRMFGLRAESMYGSMLARERDKLMSQFKRGLIDVLCTVDLFNEGVDVPDVDLVVFMRATHSRRIFVQQLGRGLRMSPGKDKVIVLDFVTDLRRIAEIAELERLARHNAPTERLPLGGRLVEFSNHSAGSFLMEWVKDQASLILREGDPTLDLPHFEFPDHLPHGGIQ